MQKFNRLLVLGILVSLFSSSLQELGAAYRTRLSCADIAGILSLKEAELDAQVARIFDYLTPDYIQKAKPEELGLIFEKTFKTLAVDEIEEVFSFLYSRYKKYRPSIRALQAKLIPHEIVPKKKVDELVEVLDDASAPAQPKHPWLMKVFLATAVLSSITVGGLYTNAYLDHQREASNIREFLADFESEVSAKRNPLESFAIADSVKTDRGAYFIRAGSLYRWDLNQGIRNIANTREVNAVFVFNSQVFFIMHKHLYAYDEVSGQYFKVLKYDNLENYALSDQELAVIDSNRQIHYFFLGTNDVLKIHNGEEGLEFRLSSGDEPEFQKTHLPYGYEIGLERRTPGNTRLILIYQASGKRFPLAAQF